jgi:anaerobic ribonucleoside-triphosphate reductase activating protein
MLRIAGIEKESITDGVGIRYTVFTQGCKHKCLGCHNPETHDINGGYDIAIDEIIEDLKSNPLLDGITLSGGDPFFQAKECTELLVRIRKELKHLNVWAYSGFTFEQLLRNKDMREMLDLVDVLVDGRFVLKRRTLESRFKGSENQRIIDVRKSLENNKVICIQL